ncbi:MAG: hydantoinase/oxoprolinase family protein [Steroidobacteraceae bacterium]
MPTNPQSAATINIDVGGTFTDCYVTSGGRAAWGKSATTHDDLSRGFLNALAEACKVLGVSTEELLRGTDLLRYSTTVALNALLQRAGPRLGLVTTRGHEDMLFIGNGRAWGDGLPVSEQRRVAQAQSPEALIPRDMVVGLRERIDCFGEVVRPVDEDDVLEAIQYLVDRGVQGIIVALMWSSANPAHERRVREILREEYPEVYLGNIPVLLSSEIVTKWREYTRGTTSILSGFLHAEMTSQLLGVGDRLRDLGYRKPLQMVQNTGGVAKLTRTRVIDTYQSGPVAGIMGGAFRARSLGIGNAICTDMGGTSFDLGLIVSGRPRYYSLRPVIDRWAVDLPLLEVKSIGAGGSSVAWLNAAFGNRLEVGPRSAGSMPGPACYGMGGTKPTVTDADVVLGYVNPENFLGGRMQLEAKRAQDAIRRHIAKPGGMSVEQAAYSIKRIVDQKMGVEIFKELVLKGFDPREFALFAYGGAGPTHCCGYAEALGIRRILLFPESSVFCAYGSSTLEVTHVYERARPLSLYDPASGAFLSDMQAFNDTVEGLEAELRRDMAAEGLDLTNMRLALELELRYGASPVTQRIQCPELRLHDDTAVRELYREFREHILALSLGIDLPEAQVRIETFVLHGSVPTHQPLQPGTDGAQAVRRDAPPKGHRDVIWDASLTRRPTPVHAVEDLRVGDVITGPAIAEARDTTYVVAPGWQLRVLPGGVSEMTRTVGDGAAVGAPSAIGGA